MVVFGVLGSMAKEFGVLVMGIYDYVLFHFP